MRMHGRELLLALLTGASLTISFAPTSLVFFSYFSVISLIWLYRNSIHRKFAYSAMIGLSWGVGFFGTQVSWVFISIYRYGGNNLLSSGLITGLFILFLSLFPMINLIIMRKLRLTNPNEYRFIVGFAASWSLLEIFRGWFLTGFPWGFLGYTQLNSPLQYYASYVGVFGGSFLVVIVAGLLAKAGIVISGTYYDNKLLVSTSNPGATRSKRVLIITAYKELRPIILLLFGIFLLGFVCNYLDEKFILAARDDDLMVPSRTPQVAIIQANITPDDKFLQGSIDQVFNRIIRLYLEPSIELAQHFNGESIHKRSGSLDLIIWPENSLPLSQDHPQSQIFLQQLEQLAKTYNIGILLGMPIAVQHFNFYNSVIALGQAQGYYHKINLVPFGDYVPLANWLRGIIKFFDLPLSNFIPGSNQQPVIRLDTGDGEHKILATICYDIAYANNLRERIKSSNPDLIVAISEDGWFGDSLGPHQHLDLARFRALETGRYVLRATTTGISAIIDHRGKVLLQAPMLTKANLIGNYRYCNKHTVWNKIGNYPIIIFLWIALMLSCWPARLNKSSLLVIDSGETVDG